MDKEVEPLSDYEAERIGFWLLYCTKPEHRQLARKELIERAWRDEQVKRIAAMRKARLEYALGAIVPQRGPVCCWT